MKRLLLMLSLMFILTSCETETEKKQRKIEAQIYGKLDLRARYSVSNISTYNFESMKDYKVNDSIRIYIQNYSAKNDFGVKQSFYAIGYFNMNNGMEIEGVILDAYTSDTELIEAKKIVEYYHPMSY